MCTPKIKEYIELYLQSIDSKQLLKEEIARLIESGAFRKLKEKTTDDNGHRPMELDNLTDEVYQQLLAAFKGKGKGKGGYNNQCQNNYQYGKGTYQGTSKGNSGGGSTCKGGGTKGTKGSDKGGGKGGCMGDGSKGKGKGGGFQGNCSYCGKWGRTQRYCRKKERDWYGGAPANQFDENDGEDEDEYEEQEEETTNVQNESEYTNLGGIWNLNCLAVDTGGQIPVSRLRVLGMHHMRMLSNRVSPHHGMFLQA